MFKFATVLLIQVLCGMEMDLFIPSFPELQQVFDLSPAMVQMTLSVNFIAFCICSLFAGALGDRYNQKKILISGLIIFVIGSLMCVMATSFYLLIIGRALQGIGISAPAILSFPILLEDYSSEKQPGIMGMINGVKTLAMAIAPLIGSFVNLYFSWRGNFVVLLGFGLICLVASVGSIPSKTGNESVSLSLKTYIPLLKSQKFLSFTLGLSLLTSAYWMFMGMAPIFYMDDMGVPLRHFGYYQGALSLSFAMVCIMSPYILKRFGQPSCFYFGIVSCFFCALLILAMALLKIHQPFIITAVLVLFSIGIVFPINILYPYSLEILPYSKGRAAGVGQAIVLLLTAILLQFVGLFYNQTFMPIGLAMFVAIMLSSMLTLRIVSKKWLFS